MPRDAPESTYRVQFHKHFTFADAAGLVPYLAALGVTHLYASPCLKAAAGSTHGYDVVDYGQLNPELGGEAGFQELIEALHAHDMGLILDTVPNHMGIAGGENPWWNDVLEHGPRSRHAEYFDINWQGSPLSHLDGRVLLPVLGGHYGEILSRGELQLRLIEGRYSITYFEHRFPANKQSIAALRDKTGADSSRLCEIVSASADLMHDLLSRQHYRLAYWRTAADEINYRRFFDINALAGLQTERPTVFADTHAKTLRLIAQGDVDGLRIDHPDGLFDPEQYFHRLREAGVKYLVAEKILAMDEPLCQQWPIDGTSGYDSLNMINGLFVAGENQQPLSDVYRETTGESAEFAEIAYQSKLLVLARSFASELHSLTLLLQGMIHAHRDFQDFTFAVLHEGLRQVIACLGVYRTYIRTGAPVNDADRAVIHDACQRAITRNPAVDRSVFILIESALVLELPLPVERQSQFAGKFQQLSSPIAAKGVEDTAFYNYNRLLSLNEVGGDPGAFGIAPPRLHAFFAGKQQRWPCTMNTLSTHDTKRSEDIRARLNTLSEIPDQWRCHISAWQKSADTSGIHAKDLYLLWQSILGAWPLSDSEVPVFKERLKAYMTKALREGKSRSSWTQPDTRYEQTVHTCIENLFASDDFRTKFAAFERRIASLGMLNSLSQTVLKFTAPGVADTYQGAELFDFSLVDPDNRRPVDFRHREWLLQHCRGFDPAMLGEWHDGRIKLFVTTRLLHLRRETPRLFTHGTYLPIDAGGAKRQHIFSFVRQDERRRVLIVVPRLIATLLADNTPLPLGRAIWQDTHLQTPAKGLRSVFTGRAPASSDLADLLDELPVGVFLSD